MCLDIRGKNFVHTKHVQPLRYTQYHAPSSPSTGGVKVEDGKLKVYDTGA